MTVTWTYDETVRALYLRLTTTEQVTTFPINDAVILDFDRDGAICGVELLNQERPHNEALLPDAD